MNLSICYELIYLCLKKSHSVVQAEISALAPDTRVSCVFHYFPLNRIENTIHNEYLLQEL